MAGNTCEQCPDCPLEAARGALRHAREVVDTFRVIDGGNTGSSELRRAVAWKIVRAVGTAKAANRAARSRSCEMILPPSERSVRWWRRHY